MSFKAPEFADFAGCGAVAVGERPFIPEKPTKKMSDTPENLQFNYVFVFFWVHIICIYIKVYVLIYVKYYICQLLYVKYYMSNINMSNIICQNLFHIFYKF